MRNTRFTEDTENNVYYAEYAGKCYSIEKDKYKALTLLLGKENLDLRYVVNTLSSIGTYDECIKIEPLAELTKELEEIPDIERPNSYGDECEEIPDIERPSSYGDETYVKPVMQKPSSFLNDVSYVLPRIAMDFETANKYKEYKRPVFAMAEKYREKLFNDKDKLRRQRAYMFLSRVYKRKHNLDFTDYILYAKGYNYDVVCRYRDNLIGALKGRYRACSNYINTLRDKMEIVKGKEDWLVTDLERRIEYIQEYSKEIEIRLSVIRDIEEPPILSNLIFGKCKQSVQDYLQRGIDMICDMYNKPHTFDGFIDALTSLDEEFISKDCNLFSFLMRRHYVAFDTDLDKAIELLTDKEGSNIFLADKDFRSCLSNKLALAYTSNTLRAIPYVCLNAEFTFDNEEYKYRFKHILDMMASKEKQVKLIMKISKDKNISLREVYSKGLIEGIKNHMRRLDNLIYKMEDDESLPRVIHFKDTIIELLKCINDNGNGNDNGNDDTSDWI